MKIAIIGAAYTGLEAARYLKSKGHTITVTTTKEPRVVELEPVSDRVIVMTGEDREMMREVLAGQDAVLMTVAGGMVEKDGKYIIRFGDSPPRVEFVRTKDNIERYRGGDRGREFDLQYGCIRGRKAKEVKLGVAR